MIASMARLIYTLGTGTRSLEEFVSLLKQFEVEAVIDVRRFPGSRFAHFVRDNLARTLPDEGVEYYHLGDALGGYRKGGYEAFVASEGFRHGLENLERIAGERISAVVCAERLPWRCHRRFIGSELQRRGWRVIHVIDDRRTWVPKG